MHLKEFFVSEILILRTERCRKSDVIIRFLEKQNIPHKIKYLEKDADAQRLAKRYRILSSPGILAGGRLFNPYEWIENCQVKNPRAFKQLLLDALNKRTS